MIFQRKETVLVFREAGKYHQAFPLNETKLKKVL